LIFKRFRNLQRGHNVNWLDQGDSFSRRQIACRPDQAPQLAQTQTQVAGFIRSFGGFADDSLNCGSREGRDFAVFTYFLGDELS
jgi:hypothetical protein